ncbi:hypothetical protein BKA62DRAFT_708158 [Auriculariales sp. MPI-PUGE-AT-0066]|nr:hypothetical protein BKA62DRAFT_708158 [Auriculariales sp. MPI-PUGE-AT-0066]
MTAAATMSSTNGLKQLDSNTGIPSITRWHDAVMAQELRATAAGADAGHNSPAARWHRACVYARHLVADPSEDLDTNETPKWTRREDTVHKLMEANYWLEMIDQHHRKASNLNKYHKFWDEQYQGTENFFYGDILTSKNARASG